MQLLDLFTDNAAYVGFMLTWAVSFLCAYSYGKVGRIISGQKTGGDIKGATAEEPVSVILTVRNQAVQLRHNLPFILEQDYENFEVIVVNDADNGALAYVCCVGHLRTPCGKCLSGCGKRFRAGSQRSEASQRQ